MKLFKFIYDDFKKRVCNERGTWAVVAGLGIGAAAGTGAYFLGKPKKTKKLLEYGEISKRAMRPYTSLSEIPTGAALNERILAGLKGQDIGFAPEYAERTTSPLVASREARFKEEEMPFLSSQMSSRGLGRSTIAQEGIRRATGQKERDINEIIGQAYKEQEIQKKTDTARYQNLALSYANLERAIKAGASETDIALLKEDVANKIFDINQYATDEKAKQQNINKAIGVGTSVAGSVMGGMGGGGGVGSILGGALSQGGSAYSGGSSGGGAAGGGVSSADLSLLINYLSRSNTGAFSK